MLSLQLFSSLSSPHALFWIIYLGPLESTSLFDNVSNSLVLQALASHISTHSSNRFAAVLSSPIVRHFPIIPGTLQELVPRKILVVMQEIALKSSRLNPVNKTLYSLIWADEKSSSHSISLCTTTTNHRGGQQAYWSRLEKRNSV